MAKQHRIGILGGVFDPIHEGHIRMGICALDTGAADEILVVPAGDPPYKTCAAGPEDRWKMVVAACTCDKRLIPSRIEIDRSGSSYTADTLKLLKKKFPKDELYYVIGSDSLKTIRFWKHPEKVLSMCRFLVCPRSGIDPDETEKEIRHLTGMGGCFTILNMDPVSVSSSAIRSAFSGGQIPDCLNPAVWEYCSCKGLYGASGRMDRIDEWMDKLFSSLKAGRFAHSLSVAFTASGLARRHGIDPLKAEQAGLLHDCAKNLPLKDMRQIAESYSLTEDQAFLSSTSLLHSVVGAWVAEHRYGMTDPDVLDAIAYHNTGHAGMSRLAMCVCLADFIEPLRPEFPCLEEIRSLAGVSLEKSLLLSLEVTAAYVLSRGLYLHPQTKETISWLRSLPAVRGES